MYIIAGLLAGHGSVLWAITIKASAIDKKVDLLTGTEFTTHAQATFYYNSNNGTLAVYPQTTSASSYFTAISG